MKLAWLGLIAEIIILAIFKPLINEFEVAIILIIGINLLFVSIGLNGYNKRYMILFYLGYGIRVLAMFWDIYGQNIFSFPGSGNDTEIFFNSAVRISQDLTLLTKNIDGGIYSKIIGIIYHMAVPERMLGQYINVLAGFSIIVIIYNILKQLDINEKIMLITLSFISFFPNAIIFSAIFLRESFITLFTLVSFFYFLKWYENDKKIYIIKSLILILIASSLHAGVIGMAFGYIFMFLFYKHKNNKIVFNKNTIIYLFTFVIISIFIYNNYYHIFFAKFSNIDELSDIYGIASGRTRTGSDYLLGLKVDNLWTFIAYAPIKMFYFLTSPLPINWRGFNDILTFLIDSVLYLYILIFTFNNFKKINKKPIIVGLIIMIFFTVLIFGIGISNAGTAMRHRYKILPIMLILYALISDGKNIMNLKKKLKYKM